MEVITSYNKSELEQIIFEAVQKAINNNPIPQLPVPSDEMDFEGFLQLTGYRKPTGYKKVHEGSVPCYRRGKKLVFSRKEVLSWMESQTIRRISPMAQMEKHLAETATAMG
jgi:excisionase family DNA binding protein